MPVTKPKCTCPRGHKSTACPRHGEDVRKVIQDFIALDKRPKGGE